MSAEDDAVALWASTDSVELARRLVAVEEQLDAIRTAIHYERLLYSASNLDHPSIIDDIHRILHPEEAPYGAWDGKAANPIIHGGTPS